MTSKNEAANEMVREMNTLMEPWYNAARQWSTEAEKMQQAALENLQKALDDSHRMAREGVTLMTNISASINRQVAAQMERGKELWSSMIP